VRGEGGAPRRYVLASGNAGKRRELLRILPFLELDSLAAHPGIVFPEEGDDYATNARIKAETVLAATGIAGLADDSGLEVDALDGRPGVRSARYGGEGLDDRGRLQQLLSELAPHRDPLTARFVCLAAAALPDGRRLVERGVCEGALLRAPRGAHGFGYDPIFVPHGFDRTMAELADAEKDTISHRGKAFRALAARLAVD